MKPSPAIPSAPVSVVSDGNPFNTQVTVNGETLSNVIGLRWDIEAGGVSRMVVEFDWVEVEYEGPWVKDFSRPSLREAIGMWWRGKKRASDARS